MITNLTSICAQIQPAASTLSEETELLQTLGDNIVPISFAIIALAIVSVCVVLGTIKSISRTKSQEASRQAIARQVAERKLTVDEAQKILSTKMRSQDD